MSFLKKIETLMGNKKVEATLDTIQEDARVKEFIQKEIKSLKNDTSLRLLSERLAQEHDNLDVEKAKQLILKLYMSKLV